jgi:hypothetical protein
MGISRVSGLWDKWDDGEFGIKWPKAQIYLSLFHQLMCSHVRVWTLREFGTLQLLGVLGFGTPDVWGNKMDKQKGSKAGPTSPPPYVILLLKHKKLNEWDPLHSSNIREIWVCP